MDESTSAPINESTTEDTQAVPPAVITPPPPADQKPPEDPEFAKRFAILTRKEREILAQSDRIKGDLEGVNTWKKEKNLLKTDPHKFLEDNGWKFNDLVDFTLSNGKKSPEQQLQALQQQIEELRNEKLQEKESSERSEVEKNIANYKAEQRTYLAGKADTYELLNHFESFDMVYDIMNQHYQNSRGEMLDVDKVASEVEKYLEGQLEKATSTKKFKSRFAPSTQVTSEGRPEGVETKSPTTLTNSDVVGARTATRSDAYLDEDASKRRAAKILEEAWKRQK